MSKWTVADMPDQTGKIAIVTGANSGIGYEMARGLARKGATVILACRNLDKSEAARQQICREYPEAKTELMQLDLSDLASVRRFVDEFTSRYDKLDLLINNAGVMMTPFGKTADGFELQFGTNHLGHFALTGLLLNYITRTPGARVVTLSSFGHRLGRINFENLNAERSYSGQGAYTQSKLANLLFTYELQRRFEAAGVDALATAAHPGWTATHLQDHAWFFRMLNPLVAQRPEMGALPALFAATAPDVQGGTYYGPDGFMGWRGYPKKVRSSNRSYDQALAEKLWAVSETLTDVQYHRWSRRDISGTPAPVTLRNGALKTLGSQG
jgi:NAD(P)-dependent dehydrogenase (short-subunit alcohol dehydrogenase family)